MIIRPDDLADAILAEVTEQIQRLRKRGRIANVRAFMIGETPAAARTAAEWGSLAGRCGIEFTVHAIPAASSQPEVDSRLRSASDAPDVTGVCILPPVPSDRKLPRLVREISPRKDILGMHPENIGMALAGGGEILAPAAQAVLSTLTTAHVDVFDKTVLLVGDPYTLTIPLASALAGRAKRVTVMAAESEELASLAQQYDILVISGTRPASVACVADGAIALDLSPRGSDNAHALAGGCFCEGVLDTASAVLPAGAMDTLYTALIMQNIMECTRALPDAKPSPESHWNGRTRK